MTLNNKVYNVLKWVALIFLPALATLIMTLGDIWGIPYKEQISLTITAVDTFLGAILAISTASYKGEGVLTIVKGTDNSVITLNSDEVLAEAQKEGKILLTVETKDALPETVDE